METTTETTQKGRFGFSYAGDGTDLALLMLKNLFFTIITFGIYRAWAKTNMRRFLWENTKFMGDGGTYTGTGRELFNGWLKLFGILMVIIIGTSIVRAIVPVLDKPISFAIGIAYMFIFALATYSGLRYRLSRTLWRQIRFGVDKDEASTKEFIQLYVVGAFLSFLTLGIYYPYFKNRVRTFLSNRCRFGTVHFFYNGPDKEYFKLYITGFLLSLVTLGFYIPWFVVKLVRFRLKYTTFQGARFDFTMEGKDVFVMGIVGYLATILTFGLASPWIITWWLKKFSEHIFLDGELDLSAVKQQASDGSAMADDIVAEYDLDLGF